MTSIDFQTEKLLRNELDPDEKLLWAGKPKPGIRFHGIDIFLIPFSLIWTSVPVAGLFTSFAHPGKNSGQEPLHFISVILLSFFILIGLYMVFGRYFYDAKRREKTIYGISDKRIVILSKLFSKKVNSLNIRTLSDISLTEKKEGCGDIVFGQENCMTSWVSATQFPGMGPRVPKFEMIQDARTVYNTIVRLQNDH